jgi:small nuclear ribonucleoprotein (snRNP)-like protein
MMRNPQKLTATTVIVSAVLASGGDWVATLRAATPPGPLVARRQVQLLGVGAAVNIRLRGGEKVEGSIGAIDADSFDSTRSRGAVPRRIVFSEVTELKVAQSTYRSSGSQNADEVRRVVTALGLGQHVAVRAMSGKTFRGHIQRIDADHFQLLLDRQAGSVDIAYGDVQRVGPNSSKGKTIAIIVGVGLAVLASIYFLAELDNS